MPIRHYAQFSTLNCHWGQFWAHAAVPVGPWQDPCRLLTLVHVSNLPPNANMTWKNIMSKQQMPQNRAFFTAFYRKMQFWADATALPFWAPLALMQRPLWTPNRTPLGHWPSYLLLVYHQMQKSPQKPSYQRDKTWKRHLVQFST